MKSERLSRIVANCDKIEVVADIGCDHGLVCAELVRSGKARKAIAVDISPGSLAKAERLAKELGLEERIECRLGDGLSVLEPGEAGGILAAGMGGPLLMRILENGWKVARRAQYMVLCPQNYPDSLRQYLNEAGYEIVWEEIAREKKKFYPILKVRLGRARAYTPMELLVGRSGQRNEAWAEYVRHEIAVQAQIQRQAAGGPAGQKALERIKLYEQALRESGRER